MFLFAKRYDFGCNFCFASNAQLNPKLYRLVFLCLPWSRTKQKPPYDTCCSTKHTYPRANADTLPRTPVHTHAVGCCNRDYIACCRLYILFGGFNYNFTNYFFEQKPLNFKQALEFHPSGKILFKTNQGFFSNYSW